MCLHSERFLAELHPQPPRSVLSSVNVTGTSCAKLFLTHLTLTGRVLSFLEDTYERTLVVDGESATVILLDMWENKVRRACGCQCTVSGLAFQRFAWCQRDLVVDVPDEEGSFP